jgi:hypothetical protein
MRRSAERSRDQRLGPVPACADCGIKIRRGSERCTSCCVVFSRVQHRSGASDPYTDYDALQVLSPHQDGALLLPHEARLLLDRQQAIEDHRAEWAGGLAAILGSHDRPIGILLHGRRKPIEWPGDEGPPATLWNRGERWLVEVEREPHRPDLVQLFARAAS